MSQNLCSVAECGNRTDKQPDLCYHEFPKETTLYRKWEKLTRIADKEFYTNVKCTWRTYACVRMWLSKGSIEDFENRK